MCFGGKGVPIALVVCASFASPRWSVGERQRLQDNVDAWTAGHHGLPKLACSLAGHLHTPRLLMYGSLKRYCNCCCMLLLLLMIQPKLYPRTWIENGACFGRVRVTLRKEDGSPVKPDIPTRKARLWGGGLRACIWEVGLRPVFGVWDLMVQGVGRALSAHALIGE